MCATARTTPSPIDCVSTSTVIVLLGRAGVHRRSDGNVIAHSDDHDFCITYGMGNPFISREELQAIFARASVRRTERRAFVEIMRRMVALRASLEPLLVLRLERRLVPRESVALP
jgi:hypothetical protein